MAEERIIQQNTDEFVTALVNTIGSGTVQDVVEKNRDDALDISNIAVNLPPQRNAARSGKVSKRPLADR